MRMGKNVRKSQLLSAVVQFIELPSKQTDQRALGFSMLVERANVSQVQDKLANLKRKIEEQKNAKPRESSIATHESRVAAQIAGYDPNVTLID